MANYILVIIPSTAPFALKAPATERAERIAIRKNEELHLQEILKSLRIL